MLHNPLPRFKPKKQRKRERIDNDREMKRKGKERVVDRSPPMELWAELLGIDTVELSS